MSCVGSAGLPMDFTQEQVNSFFSTYGVVKQCKARQRNLQRPLSLSMYIYIYIYMYLYLCLYLSL